MHELIAKNGLKTKNGDISVDSNHKYKIKDGAKDLVDTNKSLGTDDEVAPSQGAVYDFVMKGNAPYNAFSMKSLGVAAGDILEPTATGARRYDLANSFVYGVDDNPATTGTGADTFLCVVNLFKNVYVGFRRLSSNGRVNTTIFWVGKDGKIVKGIDQASPFGATNIDTNSFSAVKITDGYIACAYSTGGKFFLRKLYMLGGVLVAGAALDTTLNLSSATSSLTEFSPRESNTTGSTWLWLNVANTAGSYLGVYEFSYVQTTAPTVVSSIVSVHSVTGTPTVARGVCALSLGAAKLLLITSASSTTAVVYSLDSKTITLETTSATLTKPASGNTKYTAVLTGAKSDKIVYAFIDSSGVGYVGGIYWNNETLTNIPATPSGGLTGISQSRIVALNVVDKATMILRFSDTTNKGKFVFIYLDETETLISYRRSVVLDCNSNAIADDYDFIYEPEGLFVSVYGTGAGFNATTSFLREEPCIIGVADATAAYNENVRVITEGVWSGFEGLVCGKNYYLSGDGRYTTIPSKFKIFKAITDKIAKIDI